MSNFSKYSLKEVSGVHKTVQIARWNIDGDYLGYISNDRTVKILRVDDNNINTLSAANPLNSIPTPSIATQICWHSSDNNRLALCSDDKMIEIWDVRAPKVASKISSLGGNINLSWSPSGDYIVVGNRSDNISVMDTRTLSLAARKKLPYEINEIRWSYNSDYLLAATGGEGVGAVDVIAFKNNEDLQVVDSIVAHSSNCLNLEIAPNYARMAMSGLDFAVTLWDLDELVCRQTLTLESEIRALSFNGSGRYLAVVCDDTAFLIYDCDSEIPLAKITNRTKNLDVSWHPKRDNVIALVSDDRGMNNPAHLRIVSFPQ